MTEYTVYMCSRMLGIVTPTPRKSHGQCAPASWSIWSTFVSRCC